MRLVPGGTAAFGCDRVRRSLLRQAQVHDIADRDLAATGRGLHDKLTVVSNIDGFANNAAGDLFDTHRLSNRCRTFAMGGPDIVGGSSQPRFEVGHDRHEQLGAIDRPASEVVEGDRRSGEVGWHRVSPVDIHSHADNHRREWTVGERCFREDAGQLLPTDEQIVRPFELRLDAGDVPAGIDRGQAHRARDPVRVVGNNVTNENRHQQSGLERDRPCSTSAPLSGGLKVGREYSLAACRIL